MTAEIDAGTVLVLAHAQGHDWVDVDVAQRIAAAAGAAVRAVSASLPPGDPGPLQDAAGDFAAMLDDLAETQP